MRRFDSGELFWTMADAANYSPCVVPEYFLKGILLKELADQAIHFSLTMRFREQEGRAKMNAVSMLGAMRSCRENFWSWSAAVNREIARRI